MSNLQIILAVSGAITLVAICVNAACIKRNEKEALAIPKTQAELDAMWEEDRQEERRFLARPEYVKSEVVYVNAPSSGLSKGEIAAIAVAAALIFR